MKITRGQLTSVLISFSVLALGSWGLAQASQNPSQVQRRGRAQKPSPVILSSEPQFSTGYEVGEALGIPADAHTWLTFQNTSALPGAQPWPMSVFYETPGDVADRYARIIDDPTQVGNKVLHYWLPNAVIPSGFQNHHKARIQTGFSGHLVDATEVYCKQRVFLHSDMDHLTSYPANGDTWWIGIILQELWMGAKWEGHPNPARIGLSLYPQNGELHFSLHARSGIDSSRVFWSHDRPDYDVPTGEWITLEMGYKMGDASTGRLVIVVTQENTGQREVLFDVTGWTYDPFADIPGGTGPVPLTHWNPQKLYTSDNVVDHIRGQGGVLQAYWDDFAISRRWPRFWPGR